MTFIRAWKLRKNGVCPVHLTAMALYTTFEGVDYWGHCAKCIAVADITAQKRHDNKQNGAVALATIYRARAAKG